MHNRLLQFLSFMILLIAQCIHIQTMFFAMVTCLAAISSSRPSPITTYVTFFPNLDTILSKQLSLPNKKKTFPFKTFLPSFCSISKKRDAARFTCPCLDKIRVAARDPAGPLPKECEIVPFTPQTFQALALQVLTLAARVKFRGSQHGGFHKHSVRAVYTSSLFHSSWTSWHIERFSSNSSI